MKTLGRRILAVGWLAVTLGAAGAAEHRAIVTADQVNVRGQARLNSEVVTQLREGEEVLVLEEIPVKNPQAGEPSVWARIQLPANTPVWVFAPYVEPGKGVVKVSRLNLRAGPGEQYSVLGRVERGAVVKEIRVEKNWMEIEAPQGAHAYIAASFLKPVTAVTAATGSTPSAAQPAAQPATQPAAEGAAQPGAGPATAATSPSTAASPEVAATTTAPAAPVEEPPATTQALESETAPAAPIDSTVPTATPSTPTPAPAPAVAQPEADTRRIVSREGRVIISRSIQAPTDYALESLDTRRTINYLHSEDLGVNLKVYAGRKVIVTGEELMDKRWTRTPIVEVESIRLVP
jgi:uncharacterized protein YgiM (DUF1202 family)